MRRISIAMLALLLPAFLSPPASADDTYLGPLTLKAEGKKKTYKTSFDATEMRAALLQVDNGSGGGDPGRILVVINGRKIKLKNTRGTTGRVLFLGAGNSIKIVLKGAGSQATFSIVGRTADLARLVGVGDSILAGMQDGSLVETYQVWNFGSQAAGQAAADFVLPLISEPGIPPRMAELDNGTIKPINNTQPGIRLNPEEQCDNLAVPGATVWTALEVRKSGSNPLFEIVLGGSETMVESARRLKPTFIVLLLGANDVLGMVTTPDPGDHTDVAEFARDYETVLLQLGSTGADIVAGNLPDVTAVALLVKPIPEALFNLPADAVMPIHKMLEIIATLSFNSIKREDYLTSAQLEQIRATVGEFNAEIERLCSQYGVPLVDVYSFTRGLQSSGVNVAGEHLTTAFRGGIFSLDGIHPTNTAHALLANEFIDTVNRCYGANIPRVDVAEVFESDPNRPTYDRAYAFDVDESAANPFASALRVLSSAKEIRKERRR